MKAIRRLAWAAALALSIFALVGSRQASGATIRVQFADGGGEGFNDPSAATPVGGNGGISVGEQRQIAIAHAAQIWADRLESDVEIDFEVRFSPLSCSVDSAVLGQAAPNSVHSDFDGAPRAGTFYPAALANHLAGVDLCPLGSCRNSADVAAEFNSSFGTSCPFGGRWYYGLDGAGPHDRADLVTVALHELAHGLGFLSLVDSGTGEGFLGMDDVFSNLVESHPLARRFDALSTAERVQAIVSVRELHFVGPAVLAGAARLQSGTAGGGHVRLYAPSELSPGSSLSHFDLAVGPDELMEPSLNTAIHDVGLASELFEDLGWSLRGERCTADCDGDSEVSTSDLVAAVRVALREAAVGECGPADANNDGAVAIGELIEGVGNALGGCGGSVIASGEIVRAATVTAAPGCPGDCNADRRVAVDELVRGVNIALGRGDASACTSMDRNGDGAVGINELVAAVVSALEGCPCPFDFLDPRAGQGEACVFTGRWNTECGDTGLPATFNVLEGLVGVAVVTGPNSPTLNFFARAGTGREAILVGFNFGDESVQLGGTVELSEDGRQLTIAPDVDPEVTIDDCAFERYEGSIARIVTTAAGSAEASSVRLLNETLATGSAVAAMQ